MSYLHIPPVYATPATGGTVTVPAFDGKRQSVLIEPAGLLAVLTVLFPTAADGQELVISCTQIVTALTITPAAGSVLAALTALAANIPATWTWSATASKWFRTG